MERVVEEDEGEVTCVAHGAAQAVRGGGRYGCAHVASRLALRLERDGVREGALRRLLRHVAGFAVRGRGELLQSLQLERSLLLEVDPCAHPRAHFPTS